MADQSFGPVLRALNVMQSNTASSQKAQAHKLLEEFQRSREAWTTTMSLLAGTEAVEAKLFAATTLKGKITYDLDQLPREQLSGLRDTILRLLSTYSEGPKPIRTQLCVCLANLAIQMLEWKDVLPLVGSTLGSNASDCVLEFLRVLPEEVTEGRKINLSEEDLDLRSKELLGDNADQVLQLLINYSKSSASAASNPSLLNCVTSWLREVPVSVIVKSPLLDTIINAVSFESTFEASVECLSAIYQDTRDNDESMDAIQILYPKILSLRPKLAVNGSAQDPDTFKGLTRIFAEAGEAWVVLITRMPSDFRKLVEAILECCARDTDREAISITFYFWEELKQMITIEKYLQARNEYADIFSRLVDIMIKHLEFPTTSSADETDLFEGDREQEEKFREFRHHMGDVLKDCCSVLSVTECLQKTFDIIKKWISEHAAKATTTAVPFWQQLEAPLFAMRAMGRMVPKDENVVLHQVIPLIVQIPDHAKLRFQAIMAIGRYTEWTAEHPEFLQPQLQFVISGFSHSSVEILQAAALAFRFFGTDCRHLLKHEITNLHGFYDNVLDKLPPVSQEELTEGVACIVAAQPKDKIYPAMKLYCDSVVERLKAVANKYKAAPDDKNLEDDVAGMVRLLNVFIQNVQPYYEPNETNQAVTYCQEINPVLAAIVHNFPKSTPILESVCRCWRTMVFSYRTGMSPMLPSLAEQLAAGFQETHQGCFLWATDAVLREFSAGAEYVSEAMSRDVYAFFEQQAFAFLSIMSELQPEDLPDVIEDFFRLLVDALIYFHDQLVPAAICGQILNAALSALILQQERPVLVTLHFIRDLLSYGTDNPNSSSFSSRDGSSEQQPSNTTVVNAVKSLISNQGRDLVRRLLTGMMFHFPRDCLQDASGAMLALFQLEPQRTAIWMKETIDLLPQGSIKASEGEKLLSAVAEKIQSGEMRKIRGLLQDFTTSYRRRNVTPREGLGRLEGAKLELQA